MTKWNRLLVILGCFLLIFALAGVGFGLILTIQHTLLLFSLGALVAYALNPLVDLLHNLRVGKNKHPISRELSVTAVFLGLIVVIGLAFYSLGGRLVEQVTIVQHDFPTYQAHVVNLAEQADKRLAAHHINVNIAQKIQHPPPDAVAFGIHIEKQVLPFVEHLFTDIGESLVVLLIALYFLLYSTDMREKFNALLPDQFGKRVQLWEVDVNRILGSFVRGQVVIALITGAAAAVGCLGVGIRLWLLIGIFVAVTSLIPVFGAYLGGVPAIIAALVGPTRLSSPGIAAVIILVIFIVINEVASKVLYPKLVGSALGLHTVLVLFVLFAGLEAGGIVGVLFAPAIAALFIVTLVHVYRFWQDLPDNLLSTVAREEGKKALDDQAAD